MRRYLREHPIRSAIIVVATLAMLLVLSAIVLTLVMSYQFSEVVFANPVCDDWRPGMTKREKILSVVRAANAQKELPFIRQRNGEQPLKVWSPQIPYDSAEDILAAEPNCCHVYSLSSMGTDYPDEVLPTNDEGVVVLGYTGRFAREPSRMFKAPVSLEMNLNTCKQR